MKMRKNTKYKQLFHPANRCIVLDFETSGLSPRYGARIIEIGMLKVNKGKIIDSF